MPLPIILDLFPPQGRRGGFCKSRCRWGWGGGWGVLQPALLRCPELQGWPATLAKGAYSCSPSRRGDPPRVLRMKSSFSWREATLVGQATQANPSVGFLFLFFILFNTRSTDLGTASFWQEERHAPAVACRIAQVVSGTRRWSVLSTGRRVLGDQVYTRKNSSTQMEDSSQSGQDLGS